MDLKIIKYQATNKFLALLIFDEKNEKYYFEFMKTEEPKIILENNVDYARDDYAGAKLFWFDKIELTLSVKAKNMGQRLYSFIEINPSEFDSMYKLLELIFND